MPPRLFEFAAGSTVPTHSQSKLQDFCFDLHLVLILSVAAVADVVEGYFAEIPLAALVVAAVALDSRACRKIRVHFGIYFFCSCLLNPLAYA